MDATENVPLGVFIAWRPIDPRVSKMSPFVVLKVFNLSMVLGIVIMVLQYFNLHEMKLWCYSILLYMK